MYTYLLINEDGSMQVTNTISKSDRYASELGVLTIVNLQRGEPSVLDTDGSWEKVEVR